MDFKTPEELGIHSSKIEQFLRTLDNAHLATHDILIARGNSIVFEKYISPFTEKFLHREYSVTKSLVSLAIGFALDDGLLSLDDPMSKFFQKELEGQTDTNFRQQTVRNMLMMATAKPVFDWPAPEYDHWDDCVKMYFQNALPGSRPGGSYFEYDSTGSFVLGALVERLTGMRLFDYLRVKLFDKIGVSKEIKILSCPGGHSWGDSASLMTARDLFLIARFVLNGGSWNGEQLISPSYIHDATSKLIETDNNPLHSQIERNGYGYYIWKSYGEGFFFNGMGCQYAVCVPEKDLILIYNGDNQGNSAAPDTIIGSFYNLIVDSTSDTLPESVHDAASLNQYADSMKLFALSGNPNSSLIKLINGRTYTLESNPMGISTFSLLFNQDTGIFSWNNDQGIKAVNFGLCENSFGVFPQFGYSDQIGGKPSDILYNCAVSGAWESQTTFHLKLQIICEYFGNADAVFEFSSDAKKVFVKMTKNAEDFLNEYNGEAVGIIQVL